MTLGFHEWNMDHDVVRKPRLSFCVGETESHDLDKDDALSANDGVNYIIHKLEINSQKAWQCNAEC